VFFYKEEDLDARITKERLGNYLSYDWLKILCVCAALVMVIIVLFTTITTRITPAQRFSVYAYTDVSAGYGVNFSDTLKKAKVFSYEVQDVESEEFSSGGQYSGALLTTRRSTGDGDAMFLTTAYEGDGSVAETSSLQSLVRAYEGMALDPEVFLADSEAYLNAFFPDGNLDKAKTKEAFFKRNTGDKRFKNEETQARGIALEEERMLLLKKDFATVKNAVESGVLPIVSVTDEKGNEVKAAFSMKNLTKLADTYYYTVETEGEKVQSVENLCVMLFDNGKYDGDLKYDKLSFLAFLVETYAS